MRIEDNESTQKSAAQSVISRAKRTSPSPTVSAASTDHDGATWNALGGRVQALVNYPLLVFFSVYSQFALCSLTRGRRRLCGHLASRPCGQRNDVMSKHSVDVRIVLLGSSEQGKADHDLRLKSAALPANEGPRLDSGAKPTIYECAHSCRAHPTARACPR